MGLGEHILGENDAWCSPESILAPLEGLFGIDFDPCGNPGNVFARVTCMLDGYTQPADKKRGLPERWIDYRARPIVVPAWRLAFGAAANTILWRDGLAADWSGRGFTYVNPPFSDIEPWLIAAQRADECAMLLPARMNAAYMHREGFAHATAVLFPDRRVMFVGATTQPPWHSMLLYFGSRPALFARALGHLGLVLPLPAAEGIVNGRLRAAA